MTNDAVVAASHEPLMPSLAELSATVNAPSLEALSRPLLDWLQRMTGLESTYLTAIDWAAGEQEILFSVNRGALNITEGARVGWSDTLCRRALSGEPAVTSDVPTVYADSSAAREMGLQSYVSVPIEMPDGQVFGTLCGCSSVRQIPSDEVLSVMRFFAQLVADRVSRDRDLQRERTHVADLEATNERIEGLEKVKSDFLRLATHELRQPTTVMSGYIDLLLSGLGGTFDERTAEILAIIGGRVEEMERLLDLMLDTARLEDDRLDLTLSSADLRDVVRRCVDKVRPDAGPDHAIELSLPSTPLPVAVDDDRICVVIGNMIDNALKYSPRGGRVSCAVRQDGDRALVLVEDEGVGMTAEQASHLFEKFARIHDEAHAGIPGTGLGLHISREVARRHRGDLEAAPGAERGSVFTLWLPLVM